jgi:ATP-binding cassette subfamily B protein
MKHLIDIVLLAKPYARQLALLSFLILINAVLPQITPFLTRDAINLITGQASPESLGNLNFILILIFIVNVAGIIITSLSNRLGDYTAARITRYLISTFYHHILTLSQTYFDSQMSGKIANQLKRGINSIGDFVNAATNFILPSILQSIITIGVLFYVSPIIGLLAFIIFPTYIYISHISTKAWGIEESKKNILEDKYTSRIVEVLQNMKLVKTSNYQQPELARINDITKTFVSIYDTQSVKYHWYNFARNGLLEITLIIIFIIVFRNAYQGIFSIGDVVLIIQLLSLLRRPLFAISFILERVQRAEAGAKEYFSILHLPSVEKIETTTPKLQFQNPGIRGENITFAYENQVALKNVSFTIKPKETVAIIGPSGAGKTTLVNLLLRLYQPTDGELFLSNQPYSKLTYSQVRAHFSYVFQDNELFSGTIAENVSYGEKLTEKQINHALKTANLTDLIKSLPEGIETQIGERGLKLSGGQKQRLQIARAIASKAPILILDEATSSLDAKSEALIQEALLKLLTQKTVVIIAHRFSTLRHVNRILVIDKGKIVDDGSPQRLSKKPGIFKELLQYQIKGNQKLLEKYDLVS